MAVLKKFVKPSSTLRWINSIPQEALDRPLTSRELGIIALHVLEWPVKARSLGLNECDIENIKEDCKNSNRLQKAAMMSRWKDIYGDKATLREFLTIAQANSWSKFADKTCQGLGYVKQGKTKAEAKKKRYWSTSALLAIAILLFAIYFSSEQEQSLGQRQSLPHLIPNFVGRQTESSELLSLLQFTNSAPRMVSITGAPGFGKSTLAIHIGHQLLKIGVNVIYVDLNEVLNTHEMMEKILHVAQILLPRKNVTSQDLYQWSASLTSKTLLLLDNCDELYHTNKDDLQGLITGLAKNSNYLALKILTTSRHHAMYTERYETYTINKLSVIESCELLHSIVHSLDSTACVSISSLTGSAPLALTVVGSLMKMPDSPSPEEIITLLNKSLIETLSPEELRTEDRINVSIFLSYKHLSENVREVGRFLSYFPASFGKNAALEVVHKSVGKGIGQKSLTTLVRMSLLEYNKWTDRYSFHRLIKEFFKNRSSRNESKAFTLIFLEYYSTILETMQGKEISETVEEFYFDRHNFIYFFSQLGEMDMKANVSQKALKTIESITNTISIFLKNNHTLLHFEFIPTLLLHNYIKSYISILNQLYVPLKNFYGKLWFVKSYSELVMNLLEIEDTLISDARKRIASMEEHRWIFDKHHNYVSNEFYVKYFFMLAKNYEAIKQNTKARLNHEKMLRRENILETCESECSNIELAEAFLFTRDIQRSIAYSNQELDRIKRLRLLNFDDALKTSEKLIRLQSIYSAIDSQSQAHSIREIIEQLVEIVEKIILQANPHDLISNTVRISKIIHLLQKASKISVTDKLKDSLKKGVETYKGKKEIMSIILTLYTKDKNYEMVTVIGESFLILLNQSSNTELHFLHYTLHCLGQSFFLLGKFDESVPYNEELVMLPGEVGNAKFEACSQLLMMSSFKCAFLMPELALHYIVTVYNEFYTFFVADSFENLYESSKVERTSVFSTSDEFLSSDLASTLTTSLTTLNYEFKGVKLESKVEK